MTLARSLPVLAALGLGLLAAPTPLRAANVDQPYQNVNKSNDAGNSTGNSQVDRLNSGQLDANQPQGSRPGVAAAPSAGGNVSGGAPSGQTGQK